jgi:hypothetical protein
MSYKGAEDQQCLDLEKIIPITQDRCICKEHIEAECNVLKDKNEVIMHTSAIVSIHNQGKNSMQLGPTDHIIKDYTNSKDDLVIKGDLRVKGWAQEDIK